MKEFELNGIVRIATYPLRSYWYTRIMFYNELDEHFVLCVNDAQQCYEDFNFYYDEYDENELVSNNGIKITITYDDEFECDCGGAIDINIKGSEKNYQWRISNDHNGWYGHTVKLGHDYKYVWEECL